MRCAGARCHLPSPLPSRIATTVAAPCYRLRFVHFRCCGNTIAWYRGPAISRHFISRKNKKTGAEWTIMLRIVNPIMPGRYLGGGNAVCPYHYQSHVRHARKLRHDTATPTVRCCDAQRESGVAFTPCEKIAEISWDHNGLFLLWKKRLLCCAFLGLTLSLLWSRFIVAESVLHYTQKERKFIFWGNDFVSRATLC